MLHPQEICAVPPLLPSPREAHCPLQRERTSTASPYPSAAHAVPQSANAFCPLFHPQARRAYCSIPERHAVTPLQRGALHPSILGMGTYLRAREARDVSQRSRGRNATPISLKGRRPLRSKEARFIPPSRGPARTSALERRAASLHAREDATPPPHP